VVVEVQFQLKLLVLQVAVVVNRLQQVMPV
jgi:hypothetical protein